MNQGRRSLNYPQPRTLKKYFPRSDSDSIRRLHNGLKHESFHSDGRVGSAIAAENSRDETPVEFRRMRGGSIVKKEPDETRYFGAGLCGSLSDHDTCILVATFSMDKRDVSEKKRSGLISASDFNYMFMTLSKDDLREARDIFRKPRNSMEAKWKERLAEYNLLTLGFSYLLNQSGFVSKRDFAFVEGFYNCGDLKFQLNKTLGIISGEKIYESHIKCYSSGHLVYPIIGRAKATAQSIFHSLNHLDMHQTTMDMSYLRSMR